MADEKGRGTMRNWGKAAIASAAVAVVLACAACAPAGDKPGAEDTADGAVQAQAQDTASGEAVGGARVSTHNYSWEKWQEEYPNQYETFIRGMDDVEDWDGKVHAHALLYANALHATYSKSSIEQSGTSCIACKSTTGAKLFDDMGVDAFLNDFDTYAGEDGELVDWYDCGLCHADGEPGGELEPGGMTAVAFGKPLFDQLSTSEEAVCGQCHNYIGAVYTRGGLMKKFQSGEADFEDANPWRYGMDPESLMKAALEDGYEMNVDEKTGIATFQANHPEVEIFQGSVHQELGLTCVSCHGVTMTAADGEEFTSHGFSESPLENPEALEYCLTCHTAQGVKDADGMVEFVHNAQQEMADAEAGFTEKQKQLQELIVAANANAGADKEALDQAKELYTKATWYVRYADGGGDTKGQKIAHNPGGELDYVQRAVVMVEEGIGLLS